MVLMAFPFKIPVPLKTDRRTADLAEGLQILQLRAVCHWIKSIYAPGAHVTILAEGILGLCMGVSPDVRKLYQESIKRLLLLLGAPDDVGIHNLDEIMNDIPQFEELWRDEEEKLKELERLGDEAFRSEYERTFQSVFRMVNSERYALEVLMDAYNESLPDRTLSGEVLQCRKRLMETAREAVFGYRAFLRARDRSGYLEKIAPESIKLTVSAKPGNLGVLPVNAQTHVLPHHGVAVHDPVRRHFTVEYLIDLRRSPLRHCPVYLETDLERKPFYYEIME
jgi:pyoverdine/dityrosine biosynthesis protein Dit1